MRFTARALGILIVVAGAIQIVLGVLFWTGYADALVPVHILVGIILVLALWTLAGLAAYAGVNIGLVLLAIVWGIIVPILGLTQTRLLPGSTHWVIQVLHLIVGLTAIALGQILAARIRQLVRTEPAKESMGITP